MKVKANYSDNAHLRKFGTKESIEIEFFSLELVELLMINLETIMEENVKSKQYDELVENVISYQNIKAAYNAYINDVISKEPAITVTEEEAEVQAYV